MDQEELRLKSFIFNCLYRNALRKSHQGISRSVRSKTLKLSNLQIGQFLLVATEFHNHASFARGAATAGFVFTLYGLRHSHATQLLLDGVPVHVVAQRLGHSTPAITSEVYAHVIKRAEDRAVEAAGNMARLRCGCDLGNKFTASTAT
jgi:integrase